MNIDFHRITRHPGSHEIFQRCFQKRFYLSFWMIHKTQRCYRVQESSDQTQRQKQNDRALVVLTLCEFK